MNFHIYLSFFQDLTLFFRVIYPNHFYYRHFYPIFSHMLFKYLSNTILIPLRMEIYKLGWCMYNFYIHHLNISHIFLDISNIINQFLQIWRYIFLFIFHKVNIHQLSEFYSDKLYYLCEILYNYFLFFRIQ